VVVRVILGEMPSKRRAWKRAGPVGKRPPPSSATDCPSRESGAGRKEGKDGRRRGATTNREGTMLFATSLAGPILRVSAGGEPPIPVTEIAKGETAHRFPQFLPDGRHFLYLRVSTDANQAGVYVGIVDARPEAQSLKRILE
jgi:hypothetical protein